MSIEKNTLVVANQGEEPLEADRIFDRFYHSGSTGSTGLGLALVNSIGRYYNISIGYTFADGMHCFSACWE